MQRKPGFPMANCSIKMPENISPMASESFHCEEDVEQQQRRQQLINFGHSQWGFNNWSWTVTKQELDFVDLSNGKYTAGVVAFVSVMIKSFDIHRENIGYATSIATTKGFAIYKSRKCAVTNALRETLLSFGGSVATELMELLDSHKTDLPVPAPAPAPVAVASVPVAIAPAPAPAVVPLVPECANENNQNLPNKIEPKNSPLNRHVRKDTDPAANMRSPHPLLKPCGAPPPVARTHPMPAALPPPPPAPPRLPAPRPPVAPAAPAPAAVAAPAAHHLRPNSNEVVDRDTDEEARAERKRRQRLAQEEFRQKQLLKQKGLGEKYELNRNASGFDELVMELPSQDVVIEETAPDAKRRSPAPDAPSKRRAGVNNRLDIVLAD